MLPVMSLTNKPFFFSSVSLPVIFQLPSLLWKAGSVPEGFGDAQGRDLLNASVQRGLGWRGMASN